MRIPPSLARLCFILVGILLGAVVTPETLKGVATWPLSVALLVVAAICMMTATAWYLRLVHGWDPLSALLGASPGSMAQVMALSAEFNADVRGIAIVHVMRVLLIVLGLPAGLALFGSTVEPVVSTRGVTEASFGELALLLALSTVTALIMLRIRFPGGLMFGAMAGSGTLHGADLVHVSLPWWAGSAAVLTLGAVAGARFANTSPRILLSYLAAAFGSFAVAIAVAAAFALIVVAVLPFRIADVIVAFAPGAQDTMLVLALAPSCGVPGRLFLGGRCGATPGAASARAATRLLETAGTRNIRRLKGPASLRARAGQSRSAGLTLRPARAP